MLIAGISFTLAFVIVMVLAAKMHREVNERGGSPKCGLPVPLVRRPTSLRQAIWGGWTCETCGTEMDRRGQALVRQRFP